MSFPDKPVTNFKVGRTPSFGMKSRKRKRTGAMAYRRGTTVTLSRLKQDISDVDSDISREVGKMQQRLRRQPTDAEIRLSPKVSKLLVERDTLVSTFEQIVSQHKMHTVKLKSIKNTNPIEKVKRNFAGIRRANPFNEFKRSPLQVPSVTPQHRIMKDIKKGGTLWDPSFKLSDVSVHPKMKSHYKRYMVRW